MDRVEIQPAIDGPRILGRLTVFVDVNLAKHVGHTKRPELGVLLTGYSHQ